MAALAQDRLADAHERCAVLCEELAARTGDADRAEELSADAVRQRRLAARARQRSRYLAGPLAAAGPPRA